MGTQKITLSLLVLVWGVSAEDRDGAVWPRVSSKGRSLACDWVRRGGPRPLLLGWEEV